jgi:AraC-like DNA-binding protein
MKVLTGMTPIEYIRVIKMKKSAMLLAEGKNVNEVIDEIGFNSRSYFSKSFKAQFGVPPSEFVSGLKKEQIKRGL